MRFGMSKDGVVRATIRVNFRLTPEDFAPGVAECLDGGLPVTRTNVEREMRYLLRLNGMDEFYFERSDQDADECVREAVRLFGPAATPPDASCEGGCRWPRCGCGEGDILNGTATQERP